MKRLSIAAAALTLILGSVQAADHLDSPIVRNDPAADINDLYTFVNPNDDSELILILTAVPAAGNTSRLSGAVDYSFHLDNGSDTLSITCSFSGGGFVVHCAGPEGLSASARINQTGMGNSMRVHHGLFDDPFFFDLEAFNETVDTLEPQFTDPGTDFFAPLNTLGIVLGVDIDAVTNDGMDPVVQVWSSTNRTGKTGVQAGISGAWFAPSNPGHGFTLQVLEPAAMSQADRLYAVWNVYNDMGDQAWLIGTGEIEGNRVDMDVFITENGRFPPMFAGSGPDVRSWGQLSFEFDSCNSGEVTFTSDFPGFPASDTIPLERLSKLKGQSCALLTSGQIDRKGRPGINTVLIDLLEDTGLNDEYNMASDPATWDQFIPEIESNLEAVDTLDGETGNTVLPPEDLAPVLADDRLTIDTSEPFCDAYLAVELGVEGQCGGRTLSRDVIDDTLGAIVGPGVSDFVGFTSPIGDDFPFLADPKG